jgi:hypothetical protein
MRKTFAGIARISGLALVVLVCTLLPFSASAQPDRALGDLERSVLATMEEEARRLYGSDEAMDAAVARVYGTRISAAHVEVARTRLRRVMLHREFHRYLLQLLLPIASAETTPAQVRSAMLEGIAALQAKGLLRLPAQRQEDLAHHMLEMIRVLPPEVCKGFFFSTVSTGDANLMERAYIASLPLEKFDLILTLYTDAALAELENFPVARTLSPEQAALADQAHTQAMLRKFRGALSPEAVARVFRDRLAAPAQDACTLFTLTVEAMVDLPEPYRTWRILQFVRDMQ